MMAEYAFTFPPKRIVTGAEYREPEQLELPFGEQTGRPTGKRLAGRPEAIPKSPPKSALPSPRFPGLPEPA